MIGQYILTELVPSGLMTKVQTVLPALNGREEYVIVHTTEEQDVTVAACCGTGTNDGLPLGFDVRRCGLPPLQGFQVQLQAIGID